MSEQKAGRGRARDRSEPRVNSLASRVLTLQRTVGNAAVAGLLGRRVLAREPAYRGGGKTARNLTPRPVDVPGGLSCTVTKIKGWTFAGGKEAIEELGFTVEDDPGEKDPGHFLVRPGPMHVNQGWTLEQWAATREKLDDKNDATWHDLTKMLHSIAT